MTMYPKQEFYAQNIGFFKKEFQERCLIGLHQVKVILQGLLSISDI